MKNREVFFFMLKIESWSCLFFVYGIIGFGSFIRYIFLLCRFSIIRMEILGYCYFFNKK